MLCHGNYFEPRLNENEMLRLKWYLSTLNLWEFRNVNINLEMGNSDRICVNIVMIEEKKLTNS